MARPQWHKTPNYARKTKRRIIKTSQRRYKMAKININITLSKDERKIVLQMVGLAQDVLNELKAMNQKQNILDALKKAAERQKKTEVQNDAEK